MDTIETVLDMETWAVVGCSPDPFKTSHRIAQLLQRSGKRIIPIHPTAERILGETAYPSLADVPEPVDVVDVFRRSEHAGAHVDEAIEIGAKAVWLQVGVIDEAAAQRARDAGLLVVMDTCPAIEMPRVARARAAA